MKPARRILAVLLGAALLLGSLCACASSAGTDADTDTNTENSVAQQLYDTPVAAPELTNATTITLSGTDDVTVSDGGVYVLTGTLTDGRVLVNAPDADVTLVLQDADITCSDSSALYIYKAASVLVYLPDGTASTLTDDSSYDYSDGVSSAADEEPNACLYAKSDLIIAGGGTLTVTGNAGNGITGKDTLKIEDTAVSVTAANHGINGKDRLVLKQADVTVTSGGDALRATNDSDTALGCVLIGASALTLTAGEDGIQAETTLTLFDTTGTVTSGGGSGAALSGDVSAKGIKAGTDITVRSGSYTLDCADDAVHANGTVTVSGGEIYVSGPTSDGDSAIDHDGSATVTGGTVIAAGYSGMAQNFGTDSTQGSILLTSRSTSTETIRVTDASGSVLAEFAPAKAYSCVIVSTPALKQGGTYTVTMGGESTDVTLESLIYGTGGMGGQPGGGNMGTPPDGNGGGMGTPPDGNDGKGGRPGQ